MELRRPGYQRKSISFSGARSDAIRVELEPRPSPRSRRPRVSSGTPPRTPLGKGKEPAGRPALDAELLSR
jgi:hypothetical protein